MFYSYTKSEHKNMLARFSLKRNAPSSCCYLSKSFVVEKRHEAMKKLFIKIKRKRKKVEKIDKCPRYLKQWVLRCLPKKRR